MHPVPGTVWKRLVFAEPIGKRDAGREKDFASYLIPKPNETNRFLLLSRKDHIDFYVGSSSRESIGLMESYFHLCYNTAAESMEPERVSGNTLCYVNTRKKNIKAKELQESGFIRSVAYIPYSMEGMALDYEVIIVSHSFRNKTKYSFMVRITISGDGEQIKSAETALRMKFMELYHSIGMKMKLKPERRRIVGLRKNVLGVPFKLTTFVGIPTDEETR